MTDIQTIPLLNLSLAFIPAALTIAILFNWSLGGKRAVLGVVRMLLQLLLIGYVLTYIFNTDSSLVVLSILVVMVCASSWIALQSVAKKHVSLYMHALASILFGGGLTLVLVTFGVLQLDPWYAPSFMIPLAGMCFSNAMNSVSLAAERLEAELARGDDYITARGVAMTACLIPMVNSLFAVGLVALPGMMTGQILAGVSPLIAVRYQIMAMCMIFGSSGLAAAMFLVLCRHRFKQMASTA